MRCAPPANKLTITAERTTCAPSWFRPAIALMPEVIVCWRWRDRWSVRRYGSLRGGGTSPALNRVVTGDGGTDQARQAGDYRFGSYHPSQQNTFTGRLTEAMLDERCWRLPSASLALRSPTAAEGVSGAVAGRMASSSARVRREMVVAVGVYASVSSGGGAILGVTGDPEHEGQASHGGAGRGGAFTGRVGFLDAGGVDDVGPRLL